MFVSGLRTRAKSKCSFLYVIFFFYVFINNIRPRVRNRNRSQPFRGRRFFAAGSAMQGPDPDHKKETEADRDQDVSPIIGRNISMLLDRQAKDQENLSRQERIAEAITRFAGSMKFVYLHLMVFGVWIAINLGLLPFVPAFDPTLVVLAMVASVEAIFVSTFVLISQNRMAAESEKRAELSLQISLLNEHETTRLLSILSAVAEKLEVGVDVEPHEIAELKQDVSPEVVLEEIERQKPD